MAGHVNKVVIVVSGGVVNYVTSSDSQLQVIVHDLDDLTADKGCSTAKADEILDLVATGCDPVHTYGSAEIAAQMRAVTRQTGTVLAELRAPSLISERAISMRYMLSGDDFAYEQVSVIQNTSDIWDLHINPGTDHEVVIELPSLSNDGWAELETCYGTFHDAVKAAVACELKALYKRRSGPLVSVSEPDAGEPFDVLEKIVKLDLVEARKLFANGGTLAQLALGLPAMHRHPGGFSVELSECELANLVCLLGGRACSMESHLASLDESDWDSFTTTAFKLLSARKAD